LFPGRPDLRLRSAIWIEWGFYPIEHRGSKANVPHHI
jgi:hypothetical protein